MPAHTVLVCRPSRSIVCAVLLCADQHRALYVLCFCVQTNTERCMCCALVCRPSQSVACPVLLCADQHRALHVLCFGAQAITERCMCCALVRRPSQSVHVLCFGAQAITEWREERRMADIEAEVDKAEGLRQVRAYGWCVCV